MHTIVALWLTISLSFSVLDPTIRQLGMDKRVVAPPDKFLLVVASQPDCPLQLEMNRLLLGVDPGVQPKFEFRIKNIGKKPIARYTVSYRTSLATGGTLSGGRSLTKALLPGEVVAGFKKDSQVVPLSDEIRQRLRLDKDEPMLVVLMVENVVFDDGSSYDASHVSKSFFDYFMNK